MMHMNIVHIHLLFFIIVVLLMKFIVAHALTNVDTTYGTFHPLWPYIYDCTGSEYSLQSCSTNFFFGCDSPSTDLAGVRCTNIIGILNYLPKDTKLYHTSIHLKGVPVPMANCNWLEGKQAMKED